MIDPLDALQLALDVAAVPHHPLDERLHPYQRDGVAHLHAHPRAALFLIPGLGCYAYPVPRKDSPGIGRGKGKGGTCVCPECGSPFRKTKQAICPDCRAKLINACAECGEPIRRDWKFCSRTCSVKQFHSDPEHQSRAGREGGIVRGEQKKAERKTDRYMKKDGKPVHRVVAEAVMGRALVKGEVVHHEDEDKLNNHPDNLIVFPSQAVHAGHHKLNHCGSPCDCPGIRLKEVMPHESLD